ncbi:hypothetical protein [Nocardioides sp. GXQ0305]|uniref:hypothetical protein n=1 Tax=Nocardioides sp. GXQ0305 TaxID=3423912 RepID=UPI003D7C3D84
MTQPGGALSDQSVLAHGIGGAKDLPIPLSFMLVGAAVALVVSFVVLAFAWRTPRLDGAHAGRELPVWVGDAVDSAWVHWPLRLFGLAVTAYTGWAALAGVDAAANPTLGVFYIYLWVGLVPLSLALGNVWPLLSPVRTLHEVTSRLLGSPADRGMLGYPAWLGHWPAALGLFAFVWTELVSPDAELVTTVVRWFLVYAGVMLVGAAVFGDTFLARADPFEVWFGLVARLSPWGRRPDAQGRHRVVLRNPLQSLDTVQPTPGLLALVAVLLGSTAYDSFSTSIYWLRVTATPGSLDPTLRESMVLLGFIAFVLLTFTGACYIGAGLPWRERRLLPRLLAHSLVPIGVGYVFAHYLTLLLESGQAYLVFLSDPLVTGEADYLGTGSWTVVYFLSTRAELLAVLKVGFVLLGHVVAVVAAHDRAVRVLPEGHRMSGQVGMLGLMLVYTVGGLLLLFSA